MEPDTIPEPENIPVQLIRDPERPLHLKSRPLLRIGLAQGLQKIDFKVNGPFRLENLEGHAVHSSPGSELRWRARCQQTRAAQFTTSVLVDSFHHEPQALALARKLIGQGYDAWVRCIGMPVHFENGVQHNALRFRVLVGRFDGEAPAQEVMSLLNNDWRPRLVREKTAEPSGRVEYLDAELSQHQEIPLGLRLVPETPNGLVTLFQLPTVRGEQGEYLQDRQFAGVIEFRVDNGGLLGVVNEIHIDRYLRGVVPAELDPGFPLEAQKAQAVASRSNVLCMLGLKHMNDPFDFCAFDHCQCYSGTTRERERSSQAVIATSGEVMVWNEQVCDGVSTACCGGHSEAKENIWSTEPQEVLSGRLDLDGPPQRRAGYEPVDEAAFRQWVDSPPEVLCDLRRCGDSLLEDPARRHFRWREEIHRQDLEELIRRKTGVDLGTLFEVLPVSRGASGRLMELELIGSRRNLRLQKEQKIREALSPTSLYSSAFYVESLGSEGGLPVKFVFHGAGRGHGLGLCQLGAAALASQGVEYRRILAHYYPGVKLVSFYTIRPEELAEGAPPRD